MAAQILITCPECKKQLKGPADLQGKRVRCKACGKTFAVRSSAPGKSAAPQKNAAAGQSSTAKTAQPESARAEEEVAKNPYQLIDIQPSNRCPQCAAEFDSPDAVICLNCGYNTQTRQRVTTVRAYAHTPLDWAIWLAPGILCALAALAFLGLLTFIWIPAGMVAMYGDTWWGFQWGPVQIYGSVVACFVVWFTARYAYVRLGRNYRPPEKIKKLSDQ